MATRAAIESIPAARRTPVALGATLVVVTGLVAGLLPPEVGALVVVGSVLFGFSLIRPRVALYVLGLAAPVASAREIRVGPAGFSGTDALLITALVACGLAVLARGERSRLTPWIVPLVVFLLLGLLSVTWAASLPDALKELLKWLELGAVFALVAALVDTPRRAAILLLFVFVGALLEVALGAYQFVFRIGPPSFEIGRFFRAHGTFGQPNPYAGYLGMVLPLAVAIAALGTRGSTRGPWLRGLAVAAAIGAAAGMTMSQSRGAWLGAAAGLLAVTMASGRVGTLAVLLGGGVAAGVATLGAFELLPATITSRIATVTVNFGFFDVRGVVPNSENWAVVERMAHWQAALAMFEARPLLGIGIGQYAVRYPDFYVAGWLDPLGHAHNYYLNVLAEMGAVGLSLYLVVVASWVALTLALSRRGRTPFARALGLGVLGVVVATATHNLFDNLYVAGMNVHQGVLLGLAAAGLYHSAAYGDRSATSPG